MEKSADKVIRKCPYLHSTSTGKEVEVLIREDYELQYNSDHIVEKVKVGETDIVKEVESHIAEAGLINAIKNALAHGDDPSVVYGKTEPGIEVSVPVNATLDELLEISEQNKSKYLEIAKSLGVSVEDLHKAISEGSLDKLVAAASKTTEEQTGGEE